MQYCDNWLSIGLLNYIKKYVIIVDVHFSISVKSDVIFFFMTKVKEKHICYDRRCMQPLLIAINSPNYLLFLYVIKELC